jgi:hypothetical protein
VLAVQRLHRDAKLRAGRRCVVVTVFDHSDPMSLERMPDPLEPE